MFLTSSVFHVFSSLALISGTMVIASRNPIYSVLFLILTFFNLSCLLFILNIEFLPILFLIVYVGAIAVLFLFVLIMLNIKLSELKEGMKQYILISFIFGLIFIFEALTIFNIKFVSLNLLETLNHQMFYIWVSFFYIFCLYFRGFGFYIIVSYDWGNSFNSSKKIHN